MSKTTQTPDAPLLFWRMVGALDIPLADAILEDEISPVQLPRTLVKCGHCHHAAFCRIFLSARDNVVETPPSFCPNRRTLSALHAAHPASQTAVGSVMNGPNPAL